MDKIFIDTSNYFGFDHITKSLLSRNSNTLNDDEYIKKLFENYCLCSNLNMVEYLYQNSLIIKNNTDTEYIEILFTKICANSNLELIKWFWNNFSDWIDLANTVYIYSSCSNPDYNVFKWLLLKKIYSKKTCEDLFVMCLKNFSLSKLKLIYETKPQINFMVINNIYLNNSIDIYTPNLIMSWLKTIVEEKSYSIYFTTDFEIVLTDNLVSNPIELDNFLSQSNYDTQSNELVKNKINDKECPLCLDMCVEIMSNCSHKFCSYCIRLWIKKNRSCPICRKSENMKFFYLK